MKGELTILDVDGAEVGMGDVLQSIALDWGPLKVTGYSTFTHNATGATLFVVADDGREMPWHLQPTNEPDRFRTHSLKLASAVTLGIKEGES
jgi:hypothetical protein